MIYSGTTYFEAKMMHTRCFNATARTYELYISKQRPFYCGYGLHFHMEGFDS
jgi:hypothetical protein